MNSPRYLLDLHAAPEKNTHMRLTNDQRAAIRAAIASVFGDEVKVFLFGSRVDDQKRGGDIDLLVELADGNPMSQSMVVAKLQAIAEIQRRIGERKVDLVLADPSTSTPIVLNARREGVAI